MGPSTTHPTANHEREPSPARTRATIRLLLADVDGTLVTHEKVLTERARAAVEKMRSARIESEARNLVTAARSQPYYLDVTHPEGCSKKAGSALRWDRRVKK